MRLLYVIISANTRLTEALMNKINCFCAKYSNKYFLFVKYITYVKGYITINAIFDNKGAIIGK